MNFNALLNEEQNIKQNTIFKTAGEIGFLAAEFYHGIIDAQSGKISDSSQSNKLFRSVRIPQTKRDAFHTADLDKKNNHLVLLYKNNVYKVPISNEQGKIYNSIDITAAIEATVIKETREGINVGIFTTANREQAAQVYSELIKSEVNARTLQVIADALVVISIDEDSQNSEEAIKNLMLSAKNKYFDKTIQVVITKFGALGFNMEHSAVDGTSVAPVIAYISNGLKQNFPQVNLQPKKLVVEKMAWTLSAAVASGVCQASCPLF